MNRWELKDAVLASSLSPTARLVMLVLLLRADTETGRIPPEHTPSLSQIARDTGLSRSTVARIVSELDRAGWARRITPDKAEQMRGARNEYVLGAPGGSPTIGPPPSPTTGPPPTGGSPTTGPGVVRPPDHPPDAGGPAIGPPVVRPPDQGGPSTGLGVVPQSDTDLFCSSHSSSSSGGGVLDATPDRARDAAELRVIASKAQPAWWTCPWCGAKPAARCQGQRDGAYHRERHTRAETEQAAAERALDRGGPLGIPCFTCGARPGFNCTAITDLHDPSRNAPPVRPGRFHDMRAMEADVHPLLEEDTT